MLRLRIVASCIMSVYRLCIEEINQPNPKRDRSIHATSERIPMCKNNVNGCMKS